MADITKINLKGTLLTIKDQYAYHNGDLATVATSGSYNDLEDKPDIAAAQVNSDWNATSGVALILNKPDIPEDLGDLTNNAGYTKNTGTITGITMNGTSKGTSGVVNLGTVITAHQDISGKANTADLATVATSGSYNDLSNKPSIPDTSTFATKSELNGKQDTISDLASIRINSGKSIADMASNSDGTVITTLTNGDTYIIDLNHEHPQYLDINDIDDYITAGTNVTITKDSQTGAVEISASGGNNGITGITMNGNNVSVSNGIANLGTIITDISSKQDVIPNLSAIQSGATLGTTSVQSVSVNGETPLTPDANGNVDLAVSTNDGSSSAVFSINITSTTIEIQPIIVATMTVGNDVSFQVV